MATKQDGVVITNWEKLLSLGCDGNTPLELRIPTRVCNLMLIGMVGLSILWGLLAIAAIYSPPVAIANLFCVLGYTLALLLMSLKFRDAARLLGLAVATISFCFYILAIRPNTTGVEFFLVGLVAAPIIVFTTAERKKIVFSIVGVLTMCAASFYISQTTEGLFRVSQFEASAAYYLAVFSLTSFVGFGIWYFNFGFVKNLVALEKERQKTEDLLANALPRLIAKRLKDGEITIADSHAEAVVLFADMVGFSQMAQRLSPRHIVEMLNELFTRFDRLAERRGIEKIKTIGDCYMAVGGLFADSNTEVENVLEFALEMRDTCNEMGNRAEFPIHLRIGIATGQIISGVIGESRTAFDIWGQTVNLASRMELTGRDGEIQVSESTYWRLRDRYDFEKREGLVLKEGDVVTSYFLLGRNQNNNNTSGSIDGPFQAAPCAPQTKSMS